MIKKFSVKNFQSIKEKMDITFVASALSDETSYTNYFDFKGDRILKASAFYGMNASGKSTIVRALAVLSELVAQQNPAFSFAMPQQAIKRMVSYYPFKFSDETKNSPTSFEIEFSLNNSDDSPLYKYHIEYDSSRIIDEKFEKMTSQKYSLLFERNTDKNLRTNIIIGNSATNSPLLEALKSSVVPDKTFLSLFNNFNVNDFYDAYLFFAQRMINISPEVTRFDDIMPDRIEKDPGLRDFEIKLLKAADFNIDDVHVSKSKKNLVNMPGFITEKKALFLDHNVDYADKSIEFIEESLGTKKMVILASRLYDAISRPSVLIVDELEASLHPELTKMIVTLFLDETINIHNSQLIFTSHETTLLDQNLLRRDQINFVYKDKHTCGTYIVSLKEFAMRKDSNISKSYLAGRFSTSPDINEYLISGNN